MLSIGSHFSDLSPEANMSLKMFNLYLLDSTWTQVTILIWVELFFMTWPHILEVANQGIYYIQPDLEIMTYRGQHLTENLDCWHTFGPPSSGHYNAISVPLVPSNIKMKFSWIIYIFLQYKLQILTHPGLWYFKFINSFVSNNIRFLGFTVSQTQLFLLQSNGALIIHKFAPNIE